MTLRSTNLDRRYPGGVHSEIYIPCKLFVSDAEIQAFSSLTLEKGISLVSKADDVRTLAARFRSFLSLFVRVCYSYLIQNYNNRNVDRLKGSN